MRTNRLVWTGVVILALMVVIVCINAINSPAPSPLGDKSNQSVLGEASSDVSINKKAINKNAQDSKKIDVKEVTGDTVSESLKQVQVGYDIATEKNKTLDAHLNALEERVAKTENQIGSGDKGEDRVNLVADTVNQLKDTISSLSQQFSTQEKRLNTTKANGYDFSNEDLGLSNTHDSDQDNNQQVQDQKTLLNQPLLLAGYVWVKPLSKVNVSQHELPIELALRDRLKENSLLNNKSNLLTKKDNKEQNNEKINSLTPAFTIPARATLMDVTAMTAMIGRVPIGGRVQDPFPVKFILGDDNLATNGLSIPGLQGIVFEGVATGNWNLSCVSVQLTGATFTFVDGRIQHLPNTDKNNFEGQAESVSTPQPFSDGQTQGRDSIGYISSPQGVPCIGGERVTDAPQQLATLGVLGLAKSYFDAKAAAETTTTTSPDLNTGTSVTGDKRAFALSATEAGAAQTVIDFYKAHTRDSFDAIVVDPGASVALHITRDLYVDYNPRSRKIAYGSGGSYDAVSLD